MTDPIKPNEAVAKSQAGIPDVVFETFNSLLTQRTSPASTKQEITITQNEVVDILQASGLSLGKIFNEHWLDVEDLYRKAGWKVNFIKQPYYESASNYFTFTR